MPWLPPAPSRTRLPSLPSNPTHLTATAPHKPECCPCCCRRCTCTKTATRTEFRRLSELHIANCTSTSQARAPQPQFPGAALATITSLERLGLRALTLYSGGVEADLSALTGLTQLTLQGMPLAGALPPAWSSLGELLVSGLCVRAQRLQRTAAGLANRGWCVRGGLWRVREQRTVWLGRGTLQPPQQPQPQQQQQQPVYVLCAHHQRTHFGGGGG